MEWFGPAPIVDRAKTWRGRWALRVALTTAAIVVVVPTKGVWSTVVGRSLVCPENVQSADAILIENFDPNYLLFERTQALYKAGLASRVLVPANAGSNGEPSSVDVGFIAVMAGVARLDPPEVIAIHEVEPISLNAARQILTVLKKERIRSVMVVTSAFRSRRSFLVFKAVLTPAGIGVSCVPVFGLTTVADWPGTWHGIQEITEQFIKLQYYRFYVLPVYM